MGRGKRYDPDQQLNIKKVFAVVIAVVVVIMFFVAINKILTQNNSQQVNSAQKYYYSSYSNGKWGIINSNGDNVIDPIYDEMIIAVNKEKPVFICNYDVDYNNGSYKTKAIDANGNQLFSEYEKIEALENYNQKNKVWYEDNVLKVFKNAKYGMIGIDGNVVLPCEFQQVYALKGYKNCIVTVKENLYGLVDSSGKILVYNETSSETDLIKKAESNGVSLIVADVPDESKNPKNIGKWYVSKDENSSYYTDSN